MASSRIELWKSGGETFGVPRSAARPVQDVAEAEAPGRRAEQLGAGVQQLAQHMATVDRHLESTRAALAVANLHTTLEATAANFKPDPSISSEENAKALAQTLGQITEPVMKGIRNEAIRNTSTAHTQNLITGLVHQGRVKAMEAVHDHNQATFLKYTDDLLKRQATEGPDARAESLAEFVSMGRQMVASGHIKAKEWEVMREHALRQADVALVDHQIETSPATVQRSLDEPGTYPFLTAEDRLRAHTKAHTRINERNGAVEREQHETAAAASVKLSGDILRKAYGEGQALADRKAEILNAIDALPVPALLKLQVQTHVMGVLEATLNRMGKADTKASHDGMTSYLVRLREAETSAERLRLVKEAQQENGAGAITDEHMDRIDGRYLSLEHEARAASEHNANVQDRQKAKAQRAAAADGVREVRVQMAQFGGTRDPEMRARITAATVRLHQEVQDAVVMEQDPTKMSAAARKAVLDMMPKIRIELNDSAVGARKALESGELREFSTQPAGPSSAAPPAQRPLKRATPPTAPPTNAAPQVSSEGIGSTIGRGFRSLLSGEVGDAAARGMSAVGDKLREP